MPRLFVAVRLTPEVGLEVASVCDQLRTAGSGTQVRWVATENLHLTLRFFGDVADEVVAAVGGAARAELSGRAPFDVVFEGLGAFPARGRPRVLWVGVGAGSDQLAQLATVLEDRFEALGLGREQREFRPHLTIGRVREDHRGARQQGGLLRAALERASYGPTAMRVECVQVIESVLQPGGPRYRDRCVIPLGAADGRGA